MAAVQQLFEALGLVKVPRVELGEDAILLRGPPGLAIEHVIVVYTQENRAVVAHGTSDQPWLRLGPTIFHGRTATLPLTIPTVPGRPGDTLQASVSITANGQQRFEVPVTLVVEAPTGAEGAVSRSREVPAAATKTPAQPPAPDGAGSPVSNPRPLWLTLLPAGLLVLLLLGAGLRDYLAPAHPETKEVEVVLDPVPRLENRFHDSKHKDELEEIWMTDAQPTMRFGVVTLHKGQAVGKGANVRRLDQHRDHADHSRGDPEHDLRLTPPAAGRQRCRSACSSTGARFAAAGLPWPAGAWVGSLPATTPWPVPGSRACAWEWSLPCFSASWTPCGCSRCGRSAVSCRASWSARLSAVSAACWGGVVGQLLFEQANRPALLLVGWALTGVMVGLSIGTFDLLRCWVRQEAVGSP
jgi:hypothetical protein